MSESLLISPMPSISSDNLDLMPNISYWCCSLPLEIVRF